MFFMTLPPFSARLARGRRGLGRAREDTVAGAPRSPLRLLAAVLALVFFDGRRALAEGEFEILNAYDAFGGADVKGVTQDFGFSALIKHRGKTILFDAGTNADILEKNLKALKVNPAKIDFAIISHAHPDHVSGFDYVLKANPKLKIYMPYDFQLGAPLQFPLVGPEPELALDLPAEQKYLGGKLDKTLIKSSGRFWKASVEYVSASKEIAPGVNLIVTPSPLIGYFTRYPPYEKEPQLVPMPEVSASFATGTGEVLVVACAHSGLDNIVQENKAFMKRDLELVIGGYHLLPYKADYIRAFAKRLHDEQGVKRVAPAHCTGPAGFKILKEVYGEGYLFFGLGSTIKL